MKKIINFKWLEPNDYIKNVLFIVGETARTIQNVWQDWEKRNTKSLSRQKQPR